MRRIASSVAALAMVISTAMPVPVGALDYAYLFILQTEIEGRGQAPPLLAGAREGASPSPTKDAQEGASPHPTGRVQDVGAPLAGARDEKAEFDRICGQVQAAPTLTVEELQQLIEDCESLAQRLANSENPQAKIWVQRLKMCSDFFQYSIDVMAEE